MATILPFRAIRPNALYASQLVFTKPQTESVAGEAEGPAALAPLKMLLEAGARQKPGTPEGQEKAFQEIRSNLEALLYGERLLQEQTAGFYVYEYVHDHYRQTGIWALTALADYRDGRIKTHELTFAGSVRRMKDYRRGTGLEGSPVLLTYPPDAVINGVIAEARKSGQMTVLSNPHGAHRLWKIEDPELQRRLTAAFASIKTVYLADGHHRLESAAALSGEQPGQGRTVEDTITSLYLATDQLRLQEYNRVVLPDRLIDPEELLQRLEKNFYLMESKNPVQPREPQRLGMYLYGQWYHLLVKEHTYAGRSLAEGIDAAILQEQVLAPVFGITDPRTDPRLVYAGGEKAMEEVGAVFHSHPGAIAFTLCPLTAGQLMAVADAGEVLPPKSTWTDPKVPYGLLLYQHA